MRRRPRGAVIPQDAIEQSIVSQSENLLDPSKWVDAIEAAILLKRFRRKDGKPSVGAIRNMVYRKQLQAKKVLGRLLFSRIQIERLISASPLVGGMCGN